MVVSSVDLSIVCLLALSLTCLCCLVGKNRYVSLQFPILCELIKCISFSCLGLFIFSYDLVVVRTVH